MTDEQKQALFAQLTALEAQFQAYKQSVLWLRFGNHEAVPHLTSEETYQAIQQQRDTIITLLLAASNRNGKGRRGFAAMDTTKRRLIAGLGGKRAHALGKAQIRPWQQITREIPEDLSHSHRVLAARVLWRV